MSRERPLHYILNEERKAVPCEDMFDWTQWMLSNHRQVGRTRIDGICVSTVFLGIDHNYSKVGDPLLFETMVFSETGDTISFKVSVGSMPSTISARRVSTWDEARQSHRQVCQSIRRQLKKAKDQSANIMYKFVTDTGFEM